VAITLDQLRKGPKVLMGQSNNRRFIQWYTGVADVALDDLRLQEDEVSEARWVPHAELLSWMREKPEEFVKTIPPSIVAELTESRASL
jgi:hypothetical protein